MWDLEVYIFDEMEEGGRGVNRDPNSMHGPSQCTVKIANNPTHIISSTPHKMATEEDIQAALHACNQTLNPNYTQIAKEHNNVDRSTLSRRYRGQTTSRAIANSIYRQCLTNAQEEQLIAQINKLTIRFMPPTSQIVRNMAEEIIGREVSKNWTSNFVRRYESRLLSKYLRNIDNLRAHSEYAPMFAHFYELVPPPFSFLSPLSTCFH